MIVKTQSVIHLKEGVTVTLLLTPALYGVAKERGIDLFKDVIKAKEAGNDIRVTHTIDAYSRILGLGQPEGVFQDHPGNPCGPDGQDRRRILGGIKEAGAAGG